METMHLIGAEDVRSAGNTISHAADEMKRAAGHMEDALRQHMRFMEDFLQRAEALVERIEHANAPRTVIEVGERPPAVGPVDLDGGGR